MTNYTSISLPTEVVERFAKARQGESDEVFDADEKLLYSACRSALENPPVVVEGKLAIRKRPHKISVLELDGVPIHKTLPDYAFAPPDESGFEWFHRYGSCRLTIQPLKQKEGEA